MNKKQRELKAAWNKLMQVNARPLERGAKAKAAIVNRSKVASKLPSLRIPTDRSGKHVASLDSGATGGFKHSRPAYTGTNVLGVAVMHKSCLQPVFSQETALDIAKMR